MTMSRIKPVLSILAVVVAAALIFLQYQTRQKLLAENDSLRQQIAQLKSESHESPTTNSNSIPNEDFTELLRLRGEVSSLRAQTNQIARLQRQNQQLKDSLAGATEARQQPAFPSEEQRLQEHAFNIAQMNTAKMSVVGIIMYAADNQDRLPTNFDQASAYLSNPVVATNLNQFEIVYHGSLSNVANPSSTILIRSTHPWMALGQWTKAYGFVDGHSETHSQPDGNFDLWEQQYIPVLKTP
jgi:hypothetical protein